MAIDVVVVLLQRLDLKPHDGAALPVEEKPGIDRAAEKHVVVGIEEMLGQTGNPGQKQLDGARIEDGKNLRRHDLPVGNHPYAQIRRIEPRRRLVVGHNIDAAYPRREFLHRTQGITQFVVLDVAALPATWGPPACRPAEIHFSSSATQGRSHRPKGIPDQCPSHACLSVTRFRHTGIRSNNR